jgi:hypothetical protein
MKLGAFRINSDFENGGIPQKDDFWFYLVKDILFYTYRDVYKLFKIRIQLLYWVHYKFLESNHLNQHVLEFIAR